MEDCTLEGMMGFPDSNCTKQYKGYWVHTATELRSQLNLHLYIIFLLNHLILELLQTITRRLLLFNENSCKWNPPTVKFTGNWQPPYEALCCSFCLEMTWVSRAVFILFLRSRCYPTSRNAIWETHPSST